MSVKMQKDEVQKALDRFKDHIIAQAKRNLTKGGKYGTHNVSKSYTTLSKEK